MSISNEQAMHELADFKSNRQQSKCEAVRIYDTGVFLGMVLAYWRADVITFAQYKQLTGMTEEQSTA